MQALFKAEEAKRKDLERKMIEKGNITCNIKMALEDYNYQKKEMNSIKKKEQLYNL